MSNRFLALPVLIVVAALTGCGDSSNGAKAPATGEIKTLGKTTRKIEMPPPIEKVGP